MGERFGVDSRLLLPALKTLGAMYPDRAVDQAKLNILIGLLVDVERVYESMPVLGRTKSAPGRKGEERGC